MLASAAAAVPWHRLPRDAFALVGFAAASWVAAYGYLLTEEFPGLLTLAVVIGAVSVSPQAGVVVGIFAAVTGATSDYLVGADLATLGVLTRSALMVGIGAALPWAMREIGSAAGNVGPPPSAQSPQTRASEYISVLVHEVRNPVVAIAAAGRVLARELSEHPAAQKASAIAAEANQILSLLDGLTDLASLEAARFRLALRPVDLAGTVREGVAATYVPDHTLVVRGTEFPLMVFGDERRIRQVIHNLVGNAAKYSEAGTQIEVTVGMSSDRRHAIVEVRDHGPGIPPSERWRLFEKFARLSTAGGTRGSGLGLYISRAIVRDHGGDLSADWPAGGGSVFYFSVPLTPELAVPAPARAAGIIEREAVDRTRDTLR